MICGRLLTLALVASHVCESLHYRLQPGQDMLRYQDQAKSLDQILTKDELSAVKEESFLETVYEKLGRPKLSKSSQFRADSVRNVINNYFMGKPMLTKQGGFGSLYVPLMQLARKSDPVVSLHLWLPASLVINNRIRANNVEVPVKTHLNHRPIPADWAMFELTGPAVAAIQRCDPSRRRCSVKITGLVPVPAPSLSINSGIVDLVTESQFQRKKRSVGAGSCTPGQDSCCLSSLSLNLTHIGWDFILTPQIIDFTYCGGHCDPFQLPPSMFVPQMAAIRWKIHQRGLHNLPAPCCSPRSYESIEVLYMEDLDDGMVEVKAGTLDNIMATSCGCS